MSGFSHFDKSDFPKIVVKFKSNINNYEEYREFEREWLRCYIGHNNFYFVFDTTDVGFVNPMYGYYLTCFIEKIKKMNYNLLRYSIIIVDNWYIKQLLFWVFQVQSPVADVYIVEKSVNIDNLIENINKKVLIKDDDIYIIYKDTN
tara:strand:- start:270 stop:707 length:438 start_codon:yes stop_codon:yes gene_type:complete